MRHTIGQNGHFYAVFGVGWIDVFKYFRDLIIVQARTNQEIAVKHQRGTQAGIDCRALTLCRQALIEIRLIIKPAGQRALCQGRSGIHIDQPGAWMPGKVITNPGLLFFTTGDRLEGAWSGQNAGLKTGYTVLLKIYL